MNASAAEFRPGTSNQSQRPAATSQQTSDAPQDHPRAASSLIFKRGGNFLSKYGDKAEADEKTTPAEVKPRKRVETGVGSATAPDRANVQLNQLIVNARMPEKILQVVDDNFEELNAVNLITALHRLASISVANRKVSVRKDVRFKRIVNKLSDVIRTSPPASLKPQDLSNVAWALTKLGILNSVLFSLLAEHILLRISAFEPVNLSMTLWAFARSGFLDESLFRAAAAEVKLQLPKFQPQQIANTTWAMAKGGFMDEELFQKAAEHSIERLDEFQPMNFSMLLYSFALAKQPHPRLFSEVGKRCTVKALSRCPSVPHVVSNLALAYAEAGIADQAVFDAIAKVATEQLYDFRAQQIATLADAFGKLQVHNEKLFKAIKRAVSNRFGEFKSHELQDVTAACEALGLSTSDIEKAISTGGQATFFDLSSKGMAIWIVLAILAAIASWYLRRND